MHHPTRVSKAVTWQVNRLNCSSGTECIRSCPLMSGSKSAFASPLDKVHSMGANPVGGLEHPRGQALRANWTCLALVVWWGKKKILQAYHQFRGMISSVAPDPVLAHLLEGQLLLNQLVLTNMCVIMETTFHPAPYPKCSLANVSSLALLKKFGCVTWDCGAGQLVHH